MISNIKKTLFLLGAALAISVNVYSQCDSVNTELNSKMRFLGSWQINGYPNYIEAEKDTISADIIDFINSALPETVNIIDSGYFDENLKSNTEIIDTTDVYLTFVQEKAGWKNVLGFYSYKLDSPPTNFSEIDSLTIIFPLVDSDDLFDGGERVHLGKFIPNTGIGFFLMPKGWTGDTICLDKPIIFTDKHLNTFTSEDFRQHTVLLNYEDGGRFLLGIEDQARPSGDKDFNDAVFYITAKTGAIDTVDVPKVPIAKICGDTVLCDEADLATINIKLRGTPPFNVVYNNGIEDVEISEIESNFYSFQTNLKTTFTLVSVKDAHGMGVVKGSATVELNNLNAGFVEDTLKVCEGESSGVAKIYLNGYAPFTLVYTVDGAENIIDNIVDDTLNFPVDLSTSIILTQVSDQYCTLDLSEELFVNVTEIPSAAILLSDTTLCQGEVIDVEIEFTGEAPFTFTYELNGVENTVSVGGLRYLISVGETTNIEAIAVASGSCQGTVSGNANIVYNPRPSVELTKPDIECGIGEVVELTLDFAGSAPFNFSYSISGELFNSSTNDTHTINLDVNETFELIEFSDQLCSGIVVDSLHTFDNLSSPEAEILTTSVIICENQNADIQIELRGVPPFTFVISNGTVTETVTTNKFNYTYETDQTGVFELLSVETGVCLGTTSGSASVVRTNAPVFEILFPDVDCDATSVAVVEISFSGAAPYNYSYLLDDELINGQTENEIALVEVGVGERFELASISDVNCDATVGDDQYVFYNYELTTATIQSGDLFLCDPSDVAIIEIALTGTFPITFEISNGSTSEVITTSNTAYSYETSEPGTYEIVSVTNGVCDGTSAGISQVTLYNEKPTLEFNAIRNLFCEGESTTLHFEFTGTGPWSFTLKNGATTTDHVSEENTFDLVVSEQGVYETLNFSDAHCSNDVTKNIEIGFFDQATATISGGGSFCGEEETVEVSIALTGQAPFTFTYSNGKEETQVSTNEKVYSFVTSETGTYSLVSMADANCTGMISGEAVVSNLADQFDGEITGPENVCEGEIISLIFSTNQEFTSILWTTTGEGVINDESNTSIEYTPADSESGEISFEATVTTECGKKSFSYSLIIIETPSADFVISPDELFSNSDIIFDAEDQTTASFTWEFGDGGSGNGKEVIHVYTSGGEYVVTLTVDNQGCENSSSQPVEVNTLNALYVPNVFNPNAINPENRVVKVYGTNISEEGFNFKIVNRWGNTMYHTNSFTEANTVGWDGKEYHIKEEQSLSAFTWVLRGKFNDGETFERTGTVTILQ